MKFLSHRRFNYIDITGLMWAASLLNRGQHGAALGVAVITLVLSVGAETLWGK